MQLSIFALRWFATLVQVIDSDLRAKDVRPFVLRTGPERWQLRDQLRCTGGHPSGA